MIFLFIEKLTKKQIEIQSRKTAPDLFYAAVIMKMLSNFLPGLAGLFGSKFRFKFFCLTTNRTNILYSDIACGAFINRNKEIW